MKRYPIGIDAHSLTGQMTGVATYLDNTVREMAKIAEPDEIELFTNKPLSQEYHLSQRLVRGRRLWTTFWLGTHFLLRNHIPRVMLYPAHGLSWYSPAKNVVVIHDLAFELFPDHFTKSDRRRLRQLTRRSVKKADKLIAVSQATKDDLIRLYRVPADKIVVIYHGCDHQLFHPGSNLTLLREKFGITRPYFVSVGTLQKRKNHLGLLKAWESLRQDGLEIDLVLVGGKGWLSDELEAAIEQSAYQQQIKRLGYIDREDLPALYEGATAMALPSLYEGFGMPVIEAMACGTPVVTSNNSALGELFNGVALTVEPTDQTALAAALKLMATQPQRREEFRQRALAYATKFSWQKTAEQTYRLLHQLATDDQTS